MTVIPALCRVICFHSHISVVIMDLFAAVDIYCERVDSSFWSEPINALTNLSFILAAIWGWWTYRQRRQTYVTMDGRPVDVGSDAQYGAQSGVQSGPDWQIIVAIVLVGLIGIGSFLFHTYATVWASLADVIPIWTFVAYYLFLAIHRISHIPFWRALKIYIISLAITGLVLWAMSAALVPTGGEADAVTGHSHFNGSEQYLPAVIVLFSFAAIMMARRHAARWWILAAAGTFAVSLTFRTIDMMVCHSHPLGTHWQWHLLNGLMLGFLLQALVRHGMDAAPTSAEAEIKAKRSDT